MSVWIIYLLTRCEPLATMASIVGFILTLTVAVLTIFTVGAEIDGNVEDAARFKHALKRAGIAAVLSWFVYVMTPSNTDLAVIVAGSWATSSEEMRELPDNVVSVLNKYMREYIEEETSQ